MDVSQHKDLPVNGNTLPQTANGFSSVITSCGTPPTSTTIIEELEELNGIYFSFNIEFFLLLNIYDIGKTQN